MIQAHLSLVVKKIFIITLVYKVIPVIRKRMFSCCIIVSCNICKWFLHESPCQRRKNKIFLQRSTADNLIDMSDLVLSV